MQQNVDVQNAVNAAMQEQKKKKRKKRLIIFAVLAVVIIAIIALAAGGGDEDSGKTVESANGGTTQSESSTAAETQKVEAGSIVTLDDYKVNYISCNTDFKDYDEYSEPAKGNKVVRAEFEFENTSDKDISLDGFECYADNKKCEEFYGVDDYASPTLESVGAGRTLKCVVYFEVPENAETVELEMDDELWGSGKTIFVIK